MDFQSIVVDYKDFFNLPSCSAHLTDGAYLCGNSLSRSFQRAATCFFSRAWLWNRLASAVARSLQATMSTVQLSSLSSCFGSRCEEVLEVLQGQRFAFGDFQFGKVVIPGRLGGFALGEKQQVSFHARPGLGEDATGQTDHAPEVALVQQLALGLDEGVFIASITLVREAHHS